MKKLRIILAVLAVTLVLLGVAACSDDDDAGNTSGGLMVSGEGKVSAPPDLATLSLGVQAQLSTVAEARNQAAAAMEKVMASLKASGLADKDIQTSGFSIFPVTKFDTNTQQQIILGYQVTNTVTAKIRMMDKVGSIIDAAAQAGGDLTRVQGIGFSIEDPTPFQQQAREKAFAAAMKKGEQMALLAGVKLGQPITISESGGYVSPPIKSVLPSADSGTPISPGEQEITVTVQISYEID